MSTEELFSSVKRAISNVVSIDVEEIADDANLELDLDFDSLARVEVMVELERTLRIQFPSEVLPTDVVTVTDAVRMLEQLQTPVE